MKHNHPQRGCPSPQLCPRPPSWQRTGVAVVSLLIAALLSACSSPPKVHTQPWPGAEYSRYRTFALLPLPTTGPSSDPGLMLRIAEPARQSVTDSLVAKGFTPADHAQADIAVNLRGSWLPKVEVTDWGYRPVPVYGRRGAYRGSVGYRDVKIEASEQRTLTVEIFDNRSKELVWVGWSKKEATGRVKVEKVQEGIRSILAQFPPPPSLTSPTK